MVVAAAVSPVLGRKNEHIHREAVSIFPPNGVPTSEATGLPTSAPNGVPTSCHCRVLNYIMGRVGGQLAAPGGGER
eukprot:scaffold1529_cov243-Chaetoceros_neogracile.AAC.11